MLKILNIHEWIVSIKYWSLLFIPHISIYLIYFFYILIGASIIQEIESNGNETSSLSSSPIKNFQHERERLLIRILEKRENSDLQQYTRYVYRQIRQYEEEIKRQLTIDENLSLNFSRSLFIISTTLTTIGSNEFIPKNQMGKLFIIIYTALGIPLTLVFITDLSYLIKQIILNISIYFTKFIRRLLFFRFIEDNSINSQQTSNIRKDLNIIQLILTLFLYLLIGTYFFSSKLSFLESFYLIFTTIFTIHFSTQIYHNQNFFVIMIYVFFGLAIVLLCIDAVKKQMEIFIKNVGKRLLKNLIELTHQMGFHDLYPDDLLSHTDDNSSLGPDAISFSSRYRSLTASLDQYGALRPSGLNEPLRRISSGFIRAFKTNEHEDGKRADKNVQVSTIIRRCGRCAETNLPIRPVRKHNAISSSSSSLTDYNSNCEDDDIIDFPPPTLDRIRQRRATLVAKTIINQLSTQPRSTMDELLPPYLGTNKPRPRSMDASPVLPRCTIEISPSSRSDSPNRDEFSQIAKKISSLLTPTDDENE